jgi:membrane-bound lytic murein transglycosylase D
VEARGGDGGDRGVPAGAGRIVEPAEITHRVASGETLWSISRRYGVGLESLRGWNGLGPRAVLQVGQRLTVRTGGEAVAPSAAPRIHVVRSGDTLGGIARRYGVGTEALARENGLGLRATIRPGDRLQVPGANE